jgi:hypothetical protein
LKWRLLDADWPRPSAGGIALGALADRRYRAGHKGHASGFAVGETRSAMAHPARTFRRMTFILQVSHDSLRKTSDFQRSPARPALVGPIAAPTARGHPEAIACDRRERRSEATERPLGLGRWRSNRLT